MTGQEAIRYIEDQGWSATRLGLDRTRELLGLLGDPQRQLKFVHITGSNGKGSTSAMLDSILRAAGFRVGLYTSPYIEDFTERIRVDGENIPMDALGELTERVKAAAGRMADHPSQFELCTAVGMLWFARQRCDIVVLEVGMGGALDSTNVIDAPEVAVVTNLGLDHTEYLGGTLEDIARTKAGIVKPGCHCVCYDGPPEGVAVVEEVCRTLAVPFHLVDFSKVIPLTRDLTDQTFTWRWSTYRMPLLGRHQLRNAATALTVVETLRELGWRVPDEAVARGLREVRWPARLEVLGREPLFVLDGGHNPQCAQALRQFLEDYLPGQRVTLLLGVLADKDWREMADILAPCAGQVLCVKPASPRALDPGRLAEAFGALPQPIPAAVYPSIRAGLDAALAGSGPTVAFGSLYLAGTVRKLYREVTHG